MQIHLLRSNQLNQQRKQQPHQHQRQHQLQISQRHQQHKSSVHLAQRLEKKRGNSIRGPRTITNNNYYTTKATTTTMSTTKTTTNINMIKARISLASSASASSSSSSSPSISPSLVLSSSSLSASPLAPSTLLTSSLASISSSSSSASSSSSRSSSIKSFLMLTCVGLIALLVAESVLVLEAKPLNQYQVKFRRVPRKELSAALGASVTFECQASSSPPPTIHWLKDGKRIIQNESDENRLDDEAGGAQGELPQVDDVSRIALSTTRSRLFIDCIDFSDDATYTCVAENAYSRIASQTKLNLIRPVVDVNDDLVSEEVAALEMATGKNLDGDAPSSNRRRAISAVPQCVSNRLRTGVGPQVPARIHMWTHNIIEVMKNNVILMCRSNVKQDINVLANGNNDKSGNNNKLQAEATTTQSAVGSGKPSVTWTLPNNKVISEDQKDKYEVLETGDLLIKDLNWSDMGGYTCMVSDEQSSDQVSAFVYPTAVKSANSKRANKSFAVDLL